MPVKRRIPKARRPDLPRWLRCRLRDAELPADATHSEAFNYEFPDESELLTAWREHGGKILAQWAARHPGTRPSCWWQFDAPRLPTGTFPECYYDGALPEPRLRLGGKGTPAFECLNYVPAFAYGLPVSWVSGFDCDYYSGKARDVRGQPIGMGYIGREFSGEKFDPTDPPAFESQAGYLKRLGLLLPGEAARLGKAAFEPEILPREFWPADERPAQPDILRVLGLRGVKGAM
jgi:hypothetical protein